MKKDITFPRVQGVYVAIARKKQQMQDPDWHAYLINENHNPLENIMVSSKGYGEKKRTSVLRHFIEILEGQSYAVIEPMEPKVLDLYNEFWVSYYLDQKLYDKKFIFAPVSIEKENISLIDHLNLEGVLHK